MDDLELVARVKKGDSGAFETPVRLHHRNVYNLSFRYMKDHGAADDVTQDTFIKAFHAIESFRGEASFKSWLLRIASNTAKNMIRARGGRQMVDMDELELHAKKADFSALDRLQTSEILKKAVEQLPERQKMALELRIFEDLSFKEVAEIMDCPFDTAKANFRHAVMNLKKILVSLEGGKGLQTLEQAFESLQEDYDHDL